MAGENSNANAANTALVAAPPRRSFDIAFLRSISKSGTPGRCLPDRLHAGRRQRVYSILM
jgi:hypothetical protein